MYLNVKALVTQVLHEKPDRLNLISQLEALSDKNYLRQAYVVVTRTEETPVESIVIETKEEGLVVIDVLSNGNIKGIELVSLIH